MKQPTHKHLCKIVKNLSEDYEPWGNTHWRDGRNDCSSGCKWYVLLEGKLGNDWGVCTNEKSHRVGLLTFEHQGCDQWE